MRLLLSPYYTRNSLHPALHSSPAHYENLIEPLCFNGSCSALTCTAPLLCSMSKQMNSIWSWSYCAWKSKLEAWSFFFAFLGALSIYCFLSFEVQNKTNWGQDISLEIILLYSSHLRTSTLHLLSWQRFKHFSLYFCLHFKKMTSDEIVFRLDISWPVLHII